MTRFIEPMDDAYERSDAEEAYADALGRVVREAWVAYCHETGDDKPSHLLSYDDLDEWNQEADQRIGLAVVKWIQQREAEAVAVDEALEREYAAYATSLYQVGLGDGSERDVERESEAPR